MVVKRSLPAKRSWEYWGAEEARPGWGAVHSESLLGAARNWSIRAVEKPRWKLEQAKPPTAAQAHWPELCALLDTLSRMAVPWAGQVELVRKWYQPLMEAIYEDAAVRVGDLEKLEQIASGYPSRERFLSDLTLDPPEATSGRGGAATALCCDDARKAASASDRSDAVLSQSADALRRWTRFLVPDTVHPRQHPRQL